MIGILTFHRGPNYGGFLQAWHMRETIRSLGHQATLINYQTSSHHLAERVKLRSLRPGSLKGFVLHWLKSRPFPAPVSELSDHRFTTKPDKIDWKRFSSVVVGADIVWDFTNRHFGFDPAFYGALACQNETRFVAYAPSCGATEAGSPLPVHVKEGLGRFESISVRDEATAEITERVTGQRPPLVVDPTWLQDDPIVPYQKIPEKPYALVYGLGVTPSRAKTLKDYCKSQGLELVTCAYPCKTADRRILSIGPFEWVDLFRNAACVITSTFHGLLYAIKYRKPLLFMPNSASRSKSQLVIDRCNLGERVIEEGTPFDGDVLKVHLDQDNSTVMPEKWIRESMILLDKSL